jgi:uncharacterized protein YoxC
MPDNRVQIKVSADLAQVQGQFAGMGKSAREAFQTAAGGTEPLNRALLTNRNSVRLLAEEAGIHLPRAVSGAIADMLPGIASMGTAFLAVFAVEEVYKFGKEAIEVMHSLQGETKVLAEDWKKVIEEQEKLLRNPKSIADAQKDVAETNKRLADTQKHIADLTKELQNVPVGAALLAGFIAHELTKTEQAERKLQDRLNAQLETFTKLEVAEGKRAEREQKDADRAGKAEEQREEKLDRLMRSRHQWMIATMQLAGKVAAEEEAAAEKRVKVELNLHKIQFQGIAIMESIFALDNKTASLARTAVPQFEQQAISIKHVSDAYKEYRMVLEDITLLGQQFTTATQAEIAAVQEDLAGSVKGLADGLAGLIGGRRGQAGVEAAWEVARGIADIAEGTWPPNPAAIIAAGLHFEAAAQYGIVAGTSSGRYGGAGAGSGSYRGSQDRYGGESGRASPSPQSLAPGAASPSNRFGGQLTVLVMGEDRAGQWLAGTLNRAVDRGVTLNSTTAQRGSPVGH